MKSQEPQFKVGNKIDCLAFDLATSDVTDLSPTPDRQMSLTNQRPLTHTLPQTVNKTRGCVIFENNSEGLWDRANRTVNSNSHGVVYFASLSRWSYLSSRERSLSHSILAFELMTRCDLPSCPCCIAGACPLTDNKVTELQCALTKLQSKYLIKEQSIDCQPCIYTNVSNTSTTATTSTMLSTTTTAEKTTTSTRPISTTDSATTTTTETTTAARPISTTNSITTTVTRSPCPVLSVRDTYNCYYSTSM